MYVCVRERKYECVGGCSCVHMCVCACVNASLGGIYAYDDDAETIVLQCVAVFCSVLLQCVAVCCTVL